MKKSSNFKNRIFLAILLSATLVFCLVIAEITLALFKPSIYVYRMIKKPGKPYPAAYSPTTSFTLPKSSFINDLYTTNEWGFRGKPVPPPDPNRKRKRLVIFGDSYTFGVVVKDNETYPAYLQEIFDQKEQAVDVINAGYHAGYSPDSYYASLLQEFDYYQPDSILVALCMNNDITDVGDNAWSKTDENGFPLAVQTQRNYMNKDGTSIFLEPGAKLPLMALNIPILREFRFFVALNYVYHRYIAKDKFVSQTTRRQRGEKRFELILTAIKKFADEKNIPLNFMIIPPHERFPESHGDEDRAAQFLANKIKKPALDLRTVYAKEKDPEKMLIPGDGHFSAYGNKRVAQALYNVFYRDLASARERY